MKLFLPQIWQSCRSCARQRTMLMTFRIMSFENGLKWKRIEIESVPLGEFSFHSKLWSSKTGNVTRYTENVLIAYAWTRMTGDSHDWRKSVGSLVVVPVTWHVDLCVSKWLSNIVVPSVLHVVGWSTPRSAVATTAEVASSLSLCLALTIQEEIGIESSRPELAECLEV